MDPPALERNGRPDFKVRRRTGCAGLACPAAETAEVALAICKRPWLWHRPQSTRANFSGCGTAYVAVASDTIERRMGVRFPGGRIQTWGHSGRSFPDARDGLVAARTGLGTKLRRLRAAGAGIQPGRNGSEPE
jgi:hypothetical protein